MHVVLTPDLDELGLHEARSGLKGVAKWPPLTLMSRHVMLVSMGGELKEVLEAIHGPTELHAWISSHLAHYRDCSGQKRHTVHNLEVSHMYTHTHTHTHTHTQTNTNTHTHTLTCTQ